MFEAHVIPATPHFETVEVESSSERSPHLPLKLVEGPIPDVDDIW